MKKICVLLVLTVFSLSGGKELPSSFQKCKKTDENLIKCLTETANKGWSSLVKGPHGTDWSTIKFNPVDEEIINIFHAKITNGTISGLEEMKFNEIKIDFKRKIFTIIFTCPKLKILGNADFQAVLFGLTLSDNSPVEAIYSGGIYSLRLQYDLTKNGEKEYFKIIKNELDYNIDKLTIELSGNLNSGLKSDRIARQNKLFNDNWKIINAVSSSTARKVLGNVFSSQIEKFLEDIPFNSLFD